MAESFALLPVIHTLGMDSVPVDESAKPVMRGRSKKSVEMLPSPALAFFGIFSTRLFR